MKRAHRLISMLLVLCMVLSAIPTAVAAGTMPFTDVSMADWFYDAVEYVYENGLMSGTGATTFSPDGTTTRGMIVTILHRMEGKPTASGERFVDVADSAYYADAVAWASDRGIVSGYGNGCFGPEDPITRQQLATILLRYADYCGKNTTPRATLYEFYDADSVASYAKDAMQWAVAEDLIKGSGGYLTPNGCATRAQVATILERFCDNGGDSLLLDFFFNRDDEDDEDDKDKYIEVENLIEWDAEKEGNFYSSLGVSDSVALGVIRLEDGVRVEWSVSNGTYDRTNEETAIWTAPRTEGEATLTVVGYDDSAKQKTTLTKTIDVYSEEIVAMFESLKEDEDLAGFEYTEDPDEDYDEDGILTGEERNLGTNPYNDDTDNDLINDYDELNVYHTDPLNEDSDGDGIIDGYELVFDLDPLNSKSDGVNSDGNREFENSFSDEDEKFSLSITGNAESVASAYMETYENSYLAGSNGIVSPIVNLSTDAGSGNFETARVSYRYADDELKGAKEENLSFFYINEETKSFEKIETVVDKENNVAYADLEHFSKYVLADLTILVNDFGTADVVFVIDNSGSMQSSDPSDRRLDAVKSLASSFNEDVECAFVKFTGTAEKVIGEFRPYDSVFEEEVNKLYGTAYGGTSISAAIYAANALFDNSGANKIIILLTDGEDYDTASIDKAVAEAVSKDVRIYAIGLGTYVNSSMLMSHIAQPTKGEYFYIDDIRKVDSIFDWLGNMFAGTVTEEVYGGETIEGNVIADSGFDVMEHAYSFRNFRTTEYGGHCHGLSSTAILSYLQSLPEKKINIFGQTEYDVSAISEYRNGNLYDIDIEDEAISLWRIYNDIMALRRYDKKSDCWIFTDYVRDKIEKYGYATEYKYIDFNNRTQLVEMIQYLNSESTEFKNAEYWSGEKIDVLNCIRWWQNQLTFSDFGAYIFQDNLTKTSSVKKLIDNLMAGKPVMLHFQGSGAHDVIAERIVQSTADAQLYYVVLYDNNIPGNETYLTLKAKVKNGVVKGYSVGWSDYYENKYTSAYLKDHNG